MRGSTNVLNPDNEIMRAAQDDSFDELSPVDDHDARLQANARLLQDARRQRVRHARTLREADRKIRSGLDLIRRATLRVVSG